MKLCLFDVDGTLIDSGGAGRAALTRAMCEGLGVPDGLDGIRMDGKTDYWIIREALEKLNVQLRSDLAMRKVFSSYIPFLIEELQARSAAYRVLPGVRRLLARLEGDPGFLLGLATGNVEAGARAKLEPAGLNRFFRLGGFGSDSENRTELIRAGIAKAEALVGSKFEAIFVIGDTALDVLHGRAAGARVVAVASGLCPLDELKRSAPDLLVGSLEPIEPVLRFLDGELL